jgi:hypothetical protein
LKIVDWRFEIVSGGGALNFQFSIFNQQFQISSSAKGSLTSGWLTGTA